MLKAVDWNGRMESEVDGSHSMTRAVGSEWENVRGRWVSQLW